MPFEVVHTYVPLATVDWVEEDLDAQMPSCGGDFESSTLNNEFRRFTFRDPINIILAAGHVAMGLYLIALRAFIDFDHYEWDVKGYILVIACVGFAVVGVPDVVAHLVPQPHRPSISVLRQCVALLCCFLSAFYHTVDAADKINECGHLAAIASSNASIALPAIQERQQYCIDVVDPYPLGGYVVVLFIARTYPLQGLPFAALSVALYFVGFLLLPSQDAAHSLSPLRESACL
jgi:hypothetical protein